MRQGVKKKKVVLKYIKEDPVFSSNWKSTRG